MAKLLRRVGKPSLGYYQCHGTKAPGVMFIPGFMSKMNGRKALTLEEWCRKDERPFVRFDYTGIGSSEGKCEYFVNWVEDACDVFEDLTSGPQIIVGSSMGAHMMLHVAKRFPGRIVGLIGVAPSFTFNINRKLAKTPSGGYTMPSRFAQDGAYELSSTFLDGASDYNLFPTNESPFNLPCKLYILHGMCDESVPWAGSLDFVKSRVADSTHEVNLVLSKHGHHRMSEDDDITMLLDLVKRMVHSNCAAATKL